MLATLSLALQPGLSPGEDEGSRAEIAALEYPHRQEWLDDPELTTAGLVVLAPVQALRGDVLDRVSEAARNATEPEAVLGLVLEICEALHGEVPADLLAAAPTLAPTGAYTGRNPK